MEGEHLVLGHAVDERVARLGVRDEEGAHARREWAEEVGGQQHGGGERGEQAPRTEDLPWGVEPCGVEPWGVEPWGVDARPG